MRYAPAFALFLQMCIRDSMGAVMHACGYGADVAGADALNAAGIVFNLSAATLGNIVGGAVLIALGYWFVYAKKSEA